MPWKCGACFSIDSSDKVAETNPGIAWCANSSGNSIGDSYPHFGSVIAQANKTFILSSEQGWDDKYNFKKSVTESIQTTLLNGTVKLYSKDFNKFTTAPNLGLKLENRQWVKCYAGSMTATPNFTANISFAAWDTATAKQVDL
jgi:hypothetical protein